MSVARFAAIAAAIAGLTTAPAWAQKTREPVGPQDVLGIAKTGPSDDREPPGFDAREQSPVVGSPNRGEPIAGRYIIVFRPGTREPRREAQRIAREHDGTVDRVYEAAFPGFAGGFREQAIDGIRRNPNVELVEQDRVVGIGGTQTNATWGLDRMDQRTLPLNSTYEYATEAAGVHAYVIDTGIRLTHTEFTGRIGNGYDAVTAGGNANDCNGHGTHVAGTVGGRVYGGAKSVTLHPVRVLSCSGSGSTSGVIAGVDWVAANAIKPAVANMSLGGGASSSLDTAVGGAINKGVTMVVAAGNDNANACNYSPARVAAAITVGSTTSSDSRSSFSNYGTCLDIFAPGSSITSAWYTSDSATNTISGTSMASPHVAGVAALALAGNAAATPLQVRDQIVSTATSGIVTNVGSGSPNLLLYSRLGSTPPPPPPPPPGGNVLVNPGFEQGRVAWTESSSGGYALITTDRPRTGSYGVWMGGYNSATESVRQPVTVPSNGQLTYWWRMETSETGTTVYDRFRVQVLDANGAVVATPRTLSNASARDTWTQDTLSLSAYAGQSIHLRFIVTTDSSLATSFFLDDTSLATP